MTYSCNRSQLEFSSEPCPYHPGISRGATCLAQSV